MKILITGICGFVGSTLVLRWKQRGSPHVFFGIDNLARSGSETTRAKLKHAGATVFHGDIRIASDFEVLPDVDWVIDAAANPSVLAGIDGKSSSRQLIEHNLLSTVNMLEYCKRLSAGFTLLSTSRVYSIATLSQIALNVVDNAFYPASSTSWPLGFSQRGLGERFASTPPVSLYGATKIASEVLALEYGSTFNFPVWVNRCGVMGGAGQFGHAEQGIFSFWIHSWAQNLPLRYIGFGGQGYQVRDILHPEDLIPVLDRQIETSEKHIPRVVNLSGEIENALSLAQLSQWCCDRFGPREIASEPAVRPFDVAWLVLDSTLAKTVWNWHPARNWVSILDEVAAFAVDNPHWLA